MLERVLEKEGIAIVGRCIRGPRQNEMLVAIAVRSGKGFYAGMASAYTSDGCHVAWAERPRFAHNAVLAVGYASDALDNWRVY